jgi:hypothetical protein
VVICMWTAPLNVVRFDATTLWHFDAAERAPSTTPIATEAARQKMTLSGHARPHFAVMHNSDATMW